VGNILYYVTRDATRGELKERSRNKSEKCGGEKVAGVKGHGEAPRQVIEERKRPR